MPRLPYQNGTAASHNGTHQNGAGLAGTRVEVRGRFFVQGNSKLLLRGVTYGTFKPRADGHEYPDDEGIRRDLAAMAQHGINAVRTYTVPPKSLLDAALQNRMHVLVGIPVDRYVGLLIDGGDATEIERVVRTGVRACAGHRAVLGFTIGNELDASIVRWYGKIRTERYLHRLFRIVKSEDPAALVTYVNYPSTEYLQLPFLDFCSFNVFLEQRERFERYLDRLFNIAGDRPLLMCEMGLDSLRNGEQKQAETMSWQVEAAFERGCAGTLVYSWTDDWFRGGEEVADWAFGLTRRDRTPKPALAAVSRAYARAPFAPDATWPRFSVVICTYNGSRTIAECLSHVVQIDYPNWEVIVVDDGSTDHTAKLVEGFDVRLIRAPHAGLSAARNTGMRAASGEYVAYIDDDAYPTKDWLRYLALKFLSSSHSGIAGPNLSPPGDGATAQCIDNAPGNPTIVLLSDDEAEHLPGCNMAFRRECLLAIDGFDERFWAAGDDVDLCWRLMDRGWTLGFAPGAIVWHHRRGSIRAFWRQQFHYGKAEALLEEKWPERYNAAGHLAWRGSIYDTRGGMLTSMGRIYHGVWGRAPFQSIYKPSWSPFALVPLMPEWHLLAALLGLCMVLGLWWPRLMWAAAPLLAFVVSSAVVQSIGGARRARFPVRFPSAEQRRMRFVTFYLHLMQPLARLLGRLRYGLTPWRRRSSGFVLPRRRLVSIWAEQGRPIDAWLGPVEQRLRDKRLVVQRGGVFASWDLQIAAGTMGKVRWVTATEEHGGGRQLLRISLWPVWSRRAVVPILGLIGVGIIAVLDHQLVFAGCAAVLVLMIAVRALLDCGAAMHAALQGAPHQAAVLKAVPASEEAIVPAGEEATVPAIGDATARVVR